MMSSKRGTQLTRVILAAGVLVLGLSGDIFAASTQPEAPPSQSEKRVVRRSVLSDGSIKIEYSDGTATVQSKAALEGTAIDEPAKPSTKATQKTLPIPQPPDRLAGNTKTLEKFSEASTEYYQYLISGYRYRHQVFEWQLFSSRMIFAAVLVLVFSGILFAGTQFYIGLKRTK